MLTAFKPPGHDDISRLPSRQTSRIYPIAPPFQQQRVAPDAVVKPQPLAAADDMKAARDVKGDAGLVFGEDARLQRPDARRL